VSEQPNVESPRSSGRRENVFTHKIGPLPMWAWVGIVGGILVVWRIYASKNAAAAAAQTSASGSTAAGSTAANTVPQFVNQTYVSTTAPSASMTPAAPPVGPTPVSPWPVSTPQPPSTSPTPGVPTPKLPAPITVSGAPGSYTLGLQSGKTDEWTSTGAYSLNTIAKSHKMTAQQLINSSLAAENNVPLQKYVAKKNYNAKLPAGVQLFFPAAKWPVV
jgi:hypothetical protein